MVATGLEIPKATELSDQLKSVAIQIVRSVPDISADDFKQRRFYITDLLDDLKETKYSHEQMAIMFEIYKHLADFYLLSNVKWLSFGKQTAKALVV